LIEEWVQECREGKTRTYTEIVRALRPGLLAFLYRMTHDAEVAEELGQEAFLKAFQKVHQFDSRKSSFSTWLFTIARNQCVDYIRKQKIQLLSDGQTDGLVSLHPAPRDSAFESEMGRLIAKAVCGLELPFREVFILKEYHQ
jgi:RNA polymerase sigma factor (sigma-70 family)